MEELAQRAGEAIESLRERVDLLVLPPLRSWDLSMSAVPILDIPAGDSRPALLSLPIEADGTPNYLAFTRIGMVFTKKARKVRRAFGAALREMGAVKLPVI